MFKLLYFVSKILMLEVTSKVNRGAQRTHMQVLTPYKLLQVTRLGLKNSSGYYIEESFIPEPRLRDPSHQ